MKPKLAVNGPLVAEELSPKQERAALLLASGKSQAEAAKECGAGTRTIRTWVSQPDFSRRVSEIRFQLTNQALGMLVDGMTSAASTLGYLTRKGKSEMCRLSAARAILEMGTRLRETVELEERILALENPKQQRKVS